MMNRIWLAVAVGTALVLGTVAAAAAASTADSSEVAPATQSQIEAQAELEVGVAAEAKDRGPEPHTLTQGVLVGTFTTEDLELALDDLDVFFDEEWDEFDEELTPELIAEIDADTDALVEHLTGLGFDVTIETDDNGIREPVFANEDDDALWQAIDDYYQAQFAAEAATWSDEEKADHNAWVDEFVADLATQGITVETYEVAPGVRDIVWTEDLELALDDLDVFFDEDECEEELAEIDA